MNKKGFTLIELMISISILSLLAAIIFANFHLGRAKAMEAKALQEGRQIMTALEFRRLDSPSSGFSGGFGGGSSGTKYPDGEGIISESGIEDELIPTYISKLPEKNAYGNMGCNESSDTRQNMQYYSIDGVAVIPSSNILLSCGRGGSPDPYAIFYPVTTPAPQESSLYASIQISGGTRLWGLAGLSNRDGKCGFLVMGSNLSYTEAVRRFQLYDVYSQYRCIPISK